MPRAKRTVAAKSPQRNAGLWGFACRLYAKPGVAQACLTLQDAHRADVPLLLAALWHGVDGRGTLSAAHTRRWKAIARAWRTQIVGPLRQVRRALKPLAQTGAATLYADVKRAELAAEKLLLEALERDAAERMQRARGTRCNDAQTNARRVLQRGKDAAPLRKIISALREAP